MRIFTPMTARAHLVKALKNNRLTAPYTRLVDAPYTQKTQPLELLTKGLSAIAGYNTGRTASSQSPDHPIQLVSASGFFPFPLNEIPSASSRRIVFRNQDLDLCAQCVAEGFGDMADIYGASGTFGLRAVVLSFTGADFSRFMGSIVLPLSMATWENRPEAKGFAVVSIDDKGQIWFRDYTGPAGYDLFEGALGLIEPPAADTYSNRAASLGPYSFNPLTGVTSFAERTFLAVAEYLGEFGRRLEDHRRGRLHR